MSDISKKLLSLASIGVILCSSSISGATTEQKPNTAGDTKVVVEGSNAPLNEMGEWEVMVDTEKETINTRQLSGKPGIKVAAVLGPNSGVLAPQVGLTVYNNTSLVTTGGRTFASASMQFQITNNTGATLGKPTATGVTGVRLMMMPYSATDCIAGATTLQQPICVVTNTSANVPVTGASGRNDGTNPVYLAYITPRDGSNLSAADDTTPVELNEATGFIPGTPTDYARTIWQPTLTIPNGGAATFGMRFRYVQDAVGSGQPRVTKFFYKFRVEATRTGGAAITPGNAYVTTVAGSTQGFTDGTGRAAQFSDPYGVAVSPDGTKVYVGDGSNQRIRQINAATGAVTTLAGSTQGFTDGTGAAARFNNPYGVAVSPDGTKVYVADLSNNRIRQIDAATGAVTTLAGSTRGFTDGTGAAAQFSDPYDVAVSPDGTKVYVGDLSNNRIRQINAATGAVTTLAGSTQGFTDGTGAAARFNNPYGVAVSPDGTKVYVGDLRNQRIRQINAATGAVTTLAGSTRGFTDGTGAAAQFSDPYGVAVSPDGTKVYVGDLSNQRIRQIDAATGAVTTLAGSTQGFTDGTGAAARFSDPYGVAVSPDGTKVYVGDVSNNRIRMIQATEGQ